MVRELLRHLGLLNSPMHRTQDIKDINSPVMKSSGHCPTCERDVDFVAYNAWLRDHFVCSNCGSLPRERALMIVIDTYFPNWRHSIIHESSPNRRGTSVRLAKECSHYISSQFVHNFSLRSIFQRKRCENLEALTFDDNSIDLHVTQDVIEHVFHPSKVFSEIARTLKPGGMHIFSVPLVNKNSPSKLRARISNKKIIYLEPETYHGNPTGEGKSLVTVDWGFDICKQIFESCGLFTQIIHIDDLSRGIRAEYIEILITFKPPAIEQRDLIP